MQQDNIAAIVLAAGFCRRMGSFKPLLDLDGRPVISYVFDSLRRSGIHDIRVVVGYKSEALMPVLAELKVRAVINDRFADGMFTSVLAGIDSLEPTVKAFFLIPADMPLISPETIRHIMQIRRLHPGKILVPSFEGRKGHPPLIPVEFVGYIRAYRGENGLSGALWSLKGETVFIPVDDENVVFDFDTVERYEELRERWQRIKCTAHIEFKYNGVMRLANCRMQICLSAVLLIMCTSLLSCVPTAGRGTQTELMVFAAMSLKKPMAEIAQDYERQYPGVKVNVNGAGSSSLVAQVMAGAPADVFASASRQDLETLMEKGLIDTSAVKVFATNSVVLVVPINNELELKSFKELALDKVRRIAVGNPKLAPLGAYAAEVLSYFGIQDQIKNKLIYCDQVAQVCDYTAHGEVDAGIVYLTDYLSRQDQLELVETAPASSHRLVEYPVAVIKQSHSQLHARQFIELLCSKQGAEVLVVYGFGQLMEASR